MSHIIEDRMILLVNYGIFFVIHMFIMPIVYFVYTIQINQIRGMFSRQTEDQFY